MNLKAILAGGPVAIATVGGGVMWAQHELHYLLRPSVIETLAGVATVGGGVLWAMGKGKRKAETPAPAPAVEQSAVDERIMRLTEAMEAKASLPPAQHVQRPMVIDQQGQTVERFRSV